MHFRTCVPNVANVFSMRLEPSTSPGLPHNILTFLGLPSLFCRPVLHDSTSAWTTGLSLTCRVMPFKMRVVRKLAGIAAGSVLWPSVTWAIFLPLTPPEIVHEKCICTIHNGQPSVSKASFQSVAAKQLAMVSMDAVACGLNLRTWITDEGRSQPRATIDWLTLEPT
jgi:hypothetical protein